MLLMGKERFGRYRGKWNVCAGSVEEEDSGCLIRAACRELREEFKIQVSLQVWPLYIRNSFWLASTVVFVIKPPDGLNVHELCHVNKMILKDTHAPSTHQEMEDIRWIDVRNPDSPPMSALAKYILRRYLLQENKIKSRVEVNGENSAAGINYEGSFYKSRTTTNNT